MVTQIANIMDWQPVAWRTLMEEWPHASLQLVMSRVAEIARKQTKGQRDPSGFVTLDTADANSGASVVSALEERAVTVNTETLVEG